MYDYLIVGAGLFGAVCARELADVGKSVLVIEKRAHIAGNAYTEKIEGIDVHSYGMKCMLSIAAQHEDFDYDAFFRQFAAVWRSQMVPALLALYATGPHPLSYLRINATLAQFDEFDDYYGIGPGDGMYIAPEDRMAVW